MSFDQELATARFFQNNPEMDAPEAIVSLPTNRRSSPSFVQNAMMCVVLAISACGVGVWLLQRDATAKSNAPADFFLWICGSKLTWKEYQEQQRAQGNQRMDESEYDWYQQLFNDAYSRR
jgi:hypothetical protein